MIKDKNEPRVLALILGGGKGTRLYPLTKERSKPAVSLGGKYRLVDISISNCINSGYKKIYLLTQFNSASLHLHISNSYNFDRFSSGFVEILAAEQTLEHSGWYEGTADSVRKSLIHFKSQKPTHYIILSGDQLYKMDLRSFFEAHIKTKSEVSIATTAVTRENASSLGIMKINSKQQITSFIEKPDINLNIEDWKIPSSVSTKNIPKEKEYLASMGIYIFNADILEEVLNNDFKDFGKEVIPFTIKNKKITSYIFDGYWEDIGTIKTFYEANIKLTDIYPSFNFYDEEEPIYTHMRNLPPSKINSANIVLSLTSEGCVITECELIKSIIGVRSIIKNQTKLDGVIMMGADYYENLDELEENNKKNIPAIGIGKNCNIRKTIIDKNARIGDNVLINVSENKYTNGDHGIFYYADGIIVIRKGAIVPSGTII